MYSIKNANEVRSAMFKNLIIAAQSFHLSHV